jgi:hypothetical protein
MIYDACVRECNYVDNDVEIDVSLIFDSTKGSATGFAEIKTAAFRY